MQKLGIQLSPRRISAGHKNLSSVVRLTSLSFSIGRYFDEISQDTGKYCFGVDDTLKSLELGAVEILICWENLDIMRYLLKVPGSEATKILHLTPEQEKDKSHFTDKDASISH